MNPFVQLSELSKTTRQPTAEGGGFGCRPCLYNRQDNQPTSRLEVLL
jgi:hypothetical protein